MMSHEDMREVRIANHEYRS